MVKYVAGNIFDSDVEALVNPVNCVGVMGAGLAKQFKQKYWKNYTMYSDACKVNLVKTGHVLVCQINLYDNPKYIINFPTKDHWKAGSEMEYISSGLDDLANKIKVYSIKSIAIPPLGCGLGGLDWIKVKDLISEKLGAISDCTDVLVYAPV